MFSLKIVTSEVSNKCIFMIESDYKLDFRRFKNNVGNLWKYIDCKGRIVVDPFMKETTIKTLESVFNISIIL